MITDEMSCMKIGWTEHGSDADRDSVFTLSVHIGEE